MLLQTYCRRFAARPISMPLRAKITNPAMLGSASRNFASATDIKELPGDEPDDVVFSNKYGVRTVTLNRPKKLNSLNASMARKIVPRLQEWEKSQMANVIVVKGEGRALCAGGDVAALAQANQTGKKGQQSSKDYFALEYKLDHLIATYPKPYVAFMDGITMGGGVGLSVHAPFRIATENTVFAMPETTIGFFPDVGASFFLPRLDGALGTYLALTSEQIKGVNVFYSGIATHYLHSSSLPDLEARLGELHFKDSATLKERLTIINSTIEEFTTGLPHDQPISAPVGGLIRGTIDYCFAPQRDLDGVLDTLQGVHTGEENEPFIREWAEKTRATILQRSPTSVRVAHEQLRRGSNWSIAETFRREHAIAGKFMEHPDFVEGVSSLLIRKPRTTPQWQPSELNKVSNSQVSTFFDAEPTLDLLSTADYVEYPHAWIGLPRESQVESHVNQKGNVSKQEVVEHFVGVTNGKLGAKEKVVEILDRKTREVDGKVYWGQETEQSI